MEEFYSESPISAKRFRLKLTNDGSVTVWNALSNETYKSGHAARTESEVIFLRKGVLQNPHFSNSSIHCKKDGFYVLECGFGIGTNFLAIFNHCNKSEKSIPKIHYTGIDCDYSGLDFFLRSTKNSLQPQEWVILNEIYSKKKVNQPPYLEAAIIHTDFLSFLNNQASKPIYHAIFFDSFSPKVEAQNWSVEIFQKLYQILKPNGRLVTYSVARSTKDNLMQAGFQIEKFPLPAILKKRSALLAIRNEKT